LAEVLKQTPSLKLLAMHIQHSVLGTKLLHQPDSAITVEQFTRTRWLPTKEARWRDSSKAGANHVLSHIFREFGKTPLERVSEWTRLICKTGSTGFPRPTASLVLHSRFCLKSILEEAVDQDSLAKNPAKRLGTAKTRKVDKSTLTVEQFGPLE
jgi:hypothetical protein